MKRQLVHFIFGESYEYKNAAAQGFFEATCYELLRKTRYYEDKEKYQRILPAILVERYFENKTLQEIANDFKVSPARIRQLEIKLLQNIRNRPWKTNLLKRFVKPQSLSGPR